MKLRIVTPTEVIVDAPEVRGVTAEDATGSFGILPGHTDFLTALSVCVVTWRDHDDVAHYVAVRNGLCAVSGGHAVHISTREAVAGEDIDALRANVLTRFSRQDVSGTERLRVNAMHATAMRQVMAFLNPEIRTRLEAEDVLAQEAAVS